MRNSVRYSEWPVGRVAHAEDCKSLYIGSIPVPASKVHSYRILFRLSSAVEQSAVNRLVACSNQAAGAIKKTPSSGWCFFYGSGYLSERRPTGACLERIVGSNEPAKFEPYGARRPRLREYPIWQPSCSVERAKPVRIRLKDKINRCSG